MILRNWWWRISYQLSHSNYSQINISFELVVIKKKSADWISSLLWVEKWLHCILQFRCCFSINSLTIKSRNSFQKKILFSSEAWFQVIFFYLVRPSLTEKTRTFSVFFTVYLPQLARRRSNSTFEVIFVYNSSKTKCFGS